MARSRRGRAPTLPSYVVFRRLRGQKGSRNHFEVASKALPDPEATSGLSGILEAVPGTPPTRWELSTVWASFLIVVEEPDSMKETAGPTRVATRSSICLVSTRTQREEPVNCGIVHVCFGKITDTQASNTANITNRYHDLVTSYKHPNGRTKRRFDCLW